MPVSLSQDLKDQFREVGVVVYANVVKDDSGRSKGWGIVEFETPEEVGGLPFLSLPAAQNPGNVHRHLHWAVVAILGSKLAAAVKLVKLISYIKRSNSKATEATRPLQVYHRQRMLS